MIVNLQSFVSEYLRLCSLLALFFIYRQVIVLS